MSTPDPDLDTLGPHDQLTLKAALKRIRRKKPDLIQPCWFPETSPEPATGLGRPLNLASKFGGLSPWTPPGDENWSWPRCSECRMPKTFFCQIYIKVCMVFPRSTCQ